MRCRRPARAAGPSTMQTVGRGRRLTESGSLEHRRARAHMGGTFNPLLHPPSPAVPPPLQPVNNQPWAGDGPLHSLATVLPQPWHSLLTAVPLPFHLLLTAFRTPSVFSGPLPALSLCLMRQGQGDTLRAPGRTRQQTESCVTLAQGSMDPPADDSIMAMIAFGFDESVSEADIRCAVDPCGFPPRKPHGSNVVDPMCNHMIHESQMDCTNSCLLIG